MTLPRFDATRFRIHFMSLSRRLRREARSDDGSWARLLLLGAIDRARDGVTPTELAQSESMRSSNMAALLRDLEREGLIRRTPDAQDRRKVRVGLTAAGRDLLYGNRARRDQWLMQAIEHTLTREEQAQLAGIGELLARIAAYAPAGDWSDGPTRLPEASA